MTLEKILGFTPTNNFRETAQILWTTWGAKDYGVLPKNFNNPIIVDIGSHIGISVLYFKHRHPTAQVTCFEPNPKTFEILKKNTQGLNHVEIINAAVHDFNGHANFGVGETAWGDSLVDKEKDYKLPIKVISASEICDHPIDLLKIDAEGSEYAIINDLNNSGNINNIDHIVMEFHGKINGKHHLKKVLDAFKENDFEYTIGHDIRVLKADEQKVLTTRSKKFEYLVIHAWKVKN
ncbi:MAG: FkbM family methyltransferase [Candidatus Shapirobacteria bacterium]|jgi:FkbM family methyltransferase